MFINFLTVRPALKALVKTRHFTQRNFTNEKFHLDTSNRTGYTHTRRLEPQTHLVPESHDKAVPFRQSSDAGVRGSGCDTGCLSPSTNISTAGRPAIRGEPPVELSRGCGNARVEFASSARSVLRHLPQRTAQDCEPEVGPHRPRQPCCRGRSLGKGGAQGAHGHHAAAQHATAFPGRPACAADMAGNFA
jgi:hypothetical protein